MRRKHLRVVSITSLPEARVPVQEQAHQGALPAAAATPASQRHCEQYRLSDLCQRLWAALRDNDNLRHRLAETESALSRERERTSSLLLTLREERKLSPRNMQDEARIEYLRTQLALSVERIGIYEARLEASPSDDTKK